VGCLKVAQIYIDSLVAFGSGVGEGRFKRGTLTIWDTPDGTGWGHGCGGWLGSGGKYFGRSPAPNRHPVILAKYFSSVILSASACRFNVVGDMSNRRMISVLLNPTLASLTV